MRTAPGTGLPSASAAGRPEVAAAILGVALGGFIDGILLHQVLQWHHLLSLVEGEALRDIRVQILADGLFHVLMYAIALAGLWMLWRRRSGFTGRRSDLRIAAAALFGFSAWQAVDVAGFHWLLRIHRIRVDVPNPLVWDIGWLLVFGGASLIAGLWLWKRAGGPDDTRPASGPRAVPAALAALVIVAGPVAALPPPGINTAIVVFRSGIGEADAYAAAAAADARILWASRSGDVMAVDLGDSGGARALYGRGALFVSTSALVAGCLAWAKA